jgi:NodT family efflux transporter outer membrane factor (OMF) lipoprotein
MRTPETQRTSPGSLATLLARAVLPWTVLLAGCAVNPPPTQQEIQEQSGTIQQLRLDEPWRATGASSGEVEADWLASFGDPQLDALVQEAVAHNADLNVAAVRVEQAAAYVRLAQAALRPQIGLAGTGGINAGGGDITSALQGLMVGISWEPDLWGRLRYARNAARDSAAAVEADFAWARQSIAANVAKTWFAAALAMQQTRRTEAMAASAGELLKLAEQRERTGVASGQEVAAATVNLGNLEDSVAQLQLVQTQTLRALELLLGRYPAAELAARADLPDLPGPVPAGLPLQMLERRPDIVAAERRVAVAFDRVGEAKAAQLPRITLHAGVSALSSDILQLQQDFDNPSGGAGARLLAPLYTGGALKTQVEIHTLEQRAAIADYARMVLAALGDVEQALAAAENLASRAALLDRVVAANQQALDLAQVEYRVGSGDLRAVRAREVDLEASRLALLAVKSAQLSERINLHLALGGSFEAPPEPETATETAEAPPAEPG